MPLTFTEYGLQALADENAGHAKQASLAQALRKTIEVAAGRSDATKLMRKIFAASGAATPQEGFNRAAMRQILRNKAYLDDPVSNSHLRMLQELYEAGSARTNAFSAAYKNTSRPTAAEFLPLRHARREPTIGIIARNPDLTEFMQDVATEKHRGTLF